MEHVHSSQRLMMFYGWLVGFPTAWDGVAR
jgi:hypothetical protein